MSLNLTPGEETLFQAWLSLFEQEIENRNLVNVSGIYNKQGLYYLFKLSNHLDFAIQAYAMCLLLQGYIDALDYELIRSGGSLSEN